MIKRPKKVVRLTHKVVHFLKITRFVNEFRSTLRLIWYPNSYHRERNGEHAYQLIMLVWWLHGMYVPHLSLLKLIKYAAAHDVPEKYAVDTPAFLGLHGQHVYRGLPTHADKVEREREATNRIDTEIGGIFPDLLRSIRLYEDRADEEARLVYALDKFLAEVNIYLDKGYTDKHLGVTLRAKIESKRPKIASHPLILELYDELLEYIQHMRSDVHYEEGHPPAPPRICPECEQLVIEKLQRDGRLPV